MRKFSSILAPVLAVMLTACGGGGGSPGNNPNGTYTITLRADKLQLPVNIDPARNVAGIGVYAPYTTVLHVEARKDGAPIPGGEEIFGCLVSGGLSNGSLYYLDGNEEHMKEVDDGFGGKIKVPGSYRSITLGSNSGGNSFHFHAGDQTGTSTITCSVTEPSSKREVSASVDIVVGGATGKAASIQGLAQASYIGTVNNQNNVRNNTTVQVRLWDEASQPVPMPTNANLQVSIVGSTAAAAGARLDWGDQSGGVVRAKTTAGVGTFALTAGQNTGTILLEMVADRSDNDVTNGIQTPVTALLALSVVDKVPTASTADPLQITTTTLAGATEGVAYSYVLEVEGGVAPYTWSALGSLPSGLTLNSSGLISGTPATGTAGSFSVAARVTDSAGVSKTANLALTVVAPPTVTPPTVTPPVAPLAIVLAGCSADANVACPLPIAGYGDAYSYIFTATSGVNSAITWTTTANPAWAAISLTNGVLTINTGAMPAHPAACGNHDFVVTATQATSVVSRKVRVTIDDGISGVCP